MHESDTDDEGRATPLEALNTKRAKFQSVERADDAAVREEYQLLREAEQLGHTGSYSHDLRTGAIRWSDETYRVFGYEPKEISPSLDFVVSHVHPEDREKFTEANQALVEEDKPYDVEYRIVRKDGSIRAVCSRASLERDPAGRPVRLFGALQDITERQQMERELRVLSARHEAIVAEVPDIIAEVDAHKVYTWANQAGLEFFGPDVVGREAAFYFEGAQDTYKIVQRLFNGDPHVFYLESWQRRRDGEKRLLAWWCRALVDAEGNVTGALSTARDITDSKRAEEALREREEIYSAIVNQAADAIALVDAQSGRFVEFNRAAYESLGYRREEFAQLTVSDLDVEIGPEKIHEHMAAAFARGEAVFETRQRRRDGQLRDSRVSVRSVSIRGKDYFAAVWSDITQRRQAEEALKESERQISESLAFNRKILNTSSIGILTYRESGECTSANEAAAKIAGTEVASLRAQDFHQIQSWKKSGMYEAAREALRTGTEQEIETHVVTTFGQDVWLHLRFSSFLSGGEKQLLVFLQDVADRKRAEEALRENEQQLSSIYNTVGDVIFHLEVETEGQYRFVSVNPSFCRVTGLSQEQIVGKTVTEVIPEPSLTMVLGKYRQAIEAKTIVRWEEVSDYPTGRLTGEVSVAPVFDDQGKCTHLVGSVHDITERKRAEEALRENEAKLKTILDSSPCAIIVSDLEGRVVDANNVSLKMFGVSAKEEAIGRSALEFVSPEDRDRARDNLVKIPGDGPSGEVEYVLLRSDGSEFIGNVSSNLIRDADGRPVRIVMVASDVTERKRAAEALRESEEMLSAVVGKAKDGIILIQDGRFRFVNRALADMLGYRREELLAQPFINFVAPESRELVAQRVEARLRGENPPSVYEARILRRDGKLVDVELAATVIQHRGKLADVGIIRDITERKLAEERLLAHEGQLRVLASELSLTEERERKRIAGELHDHACQSLVLARMKLDELLATMSGPQAEAFRGISSTLNETIEGVRELTFDLSSPTLYKFGLEAALEELLDDKFRSQMDLEYSFSDDHQPKPLTDDVRVLLFQSVREVLINVIKHAQAHRISLDIRRTEGSIRIAVTDDGIGFDVDGVFSLPARHRGFGLLNIKERLDYVGGAFEIDSRPGEGSRFALVAPLKREDRDSGRDYDAGQNSAR